jgi:hypothetical protein
VKIKGLFGGGRKGTATFMLDGEEFRCWTTQTFREVLEDREIEIKGEDLQTAEEDSYLFKVEDEIEWHIRAGCVKKIEWPEQEREGEVIFYVCEKECKGLKSQTFEEILKERGIEIKGEYLEWPGRGCPFPIDCEFGQVFETESGMYLEWLEEEDDEERPQCARDYATEDEDQEDEDEPYPEEEEETGFTDDLEIYDGAEIPIETSGNLTSTNEGPKILVPTIGIAERGGNDKDPINPEEETVDQRDQRVQSSNSASPTSNTRDIADRDNQDPGLGDNALGQRLERVPLSNLGSNQVAPAQGLLNEVQANPGEIEELKGIEIPHSPDE